MGVESNWSRSRCRIEVGVLHLTGREGRRTGASEGRGDEAHEPGVRAPATAVSAEGWGSGLLGDRSGWTSAGNTGEHTLRRGDVAGESRAGHGRDGEDPEPSARGPGGAGIHRNPDRKPESGPRGAARGGPGRASEPAAVRRRRPGLQEVPPQRRGQPAGPRLPRRPRADARADALERSGPRSVPRGSNGALSAVAGTSARPGCSPGDTGRASQLLQPAPPLASASRPAALPPRGIGRAHWLSAPPTRIPSPRPEWPDRYRTVGPKEPLGP
jgi:hypothetical protein